MNRREFTKLLPVSLLFFLPKRKELQTSPPYFQSDPPDIQWADVVEGSVAGNLATIDASSIVGSAALISGILYLSANGTGQHKIEVRPTGLPGLLGFRSVSQELRGAELAIPLMVRCANNGQFEVRVTRTGLTQFGWSFSPIAWW